MEIIIQPDSETATAVATRIVTRLLREKPNAVLGWRPAAQRCCSTVP